MGSEMCIRDSTREVAETKSMQINNYSQQNEHPLVSEIEPVEEED